MGFNIKEFAYTLGPWYLSVRFLFIKDGFSISFLVNVRNSRTRILCCVEKGVQNWISDVSGNFKKSN